MEIKKVNLFFPFFIFGFIFLNLAVAIIEKIMIQSGIVNAVPTWVMYLQNEIIILSMVLIYCLVTKVKISEFRIKLLSLKEVILSLLVGYLIIPMAMFLTSVTGLFVENAASTTVALVNPYPFIVQLILIAVMPAFVEEVTFRGLFYGTYRKSGKYLGAIVLSGVLFGLFHLNFDQFVYATFMGIVLAKLTEATGSILSSMLAHFAFNTYSVTMSYLLKFVDEDIVTNSKAEAASMTVAEKATQLGGLFVSGLLFLAIAIFVIQILDKKNKKEIDDLSLVNTTDYNEQEYNKQDDKEKEDTVSTEEEKSEKNRLITIPLVCGIIMALCYMIFSLIVM
ncbi:CPBP family intramembrane glutamic endopeptidase [Lachnospira multipara]|uniref:CPBP family intramembrane glutamic endopeptidase n=1 Tax=Lachnospira multipara TaxID=28051 RepID=UPI0004E2802D|nr:type II CAAX endopeptidase family protein [Lachnospira multipara]